MSKSKLLAALAVAALVSSAAFAQTNVTVYGTVDAGLANSTSDRADNIDRKSGVMGGLLDFNKLGFRGTEDLGNGNKAIFQVETGFDIAQNGGLNTNRESFVGLQTNRYGTYRLGRLETLDSVAAGRFDAMGMSAFSPLGSVVGRVTYANSAVDFTKQYGGLTVAAQYSADGSSANANTAFGVGTKQERSVGVMAAYEKGAMDVGYAYVKTANNGRNDADDRGTHVLGGSYALPLAKVYGAYAIVNSRDLTATDIRVAMLGAKVPVNSKTTIDASYARAKDNVTDGNADIWGVQAVYSLSKRTAGYAGYQYVSNNNTQYAALNTNGVATQGTGNGVNSSGFGVGVRHNF